MQVSHQSRYEIFFVKSIGRGNLYAAAKPSSDTLQSDIGSLKIQGVTTVVSLLETQEADSLRLGSETDICNICDINFIAFPIADFGVPALAALSGIVHDLYNRLNSGENVVVHCRGGIGRTGTLCCCLLIADGMSSKQAITEVSQQRKHAVPETSAQAALINAFQHS